MKKIVVSICVIFFAVMCVFVFWRLVFLGTYELHQYSRLTVVGHYNFEFQGGFLKSEHEVQQFLVNVGSTNHVPETDYARYMWIYSPYEIDKIVHSIGAGMIFIEPTVKQKDGTSIYLVRVRQKEASGPKPMD